MSSGPLAPSVAPSPSYGEGLATVGVAVSLAIAVFARFYRLGDFPPTLHPAEDVFRQAALAVLDQGWIGLWSEMTNGQPATLAYWMAGWIRLFGDATVGLRLLPAAVGLATVGVFYLFCRSLFGGRAAALGSVLLALSVWHLRYSGLALPVNSLPLVELITLYFLFQALGGRRSNAGQRRLLVLAGLSFGVGVYLYNAFFIFAIAVLLLWAREFIAGEYSVESLARKGLAFFVPALIVALPYLGSLAVNSGQVVDRARAVAVTSSQKYRDLNGVTEQTRHILARVGRAGVTMFWRRSMDDGEGRAADRLLDPVTALLVGLGMAVSLRRWRQRGPIFLWIVVATALVAVGLTREAGLYARMMVALPAVFAAGGIALDWLLVWTRGRLSTVASYAIVAILIAIVAAHNLSSYYRHPAGQNEELWVRIDSQAAMLAGNVGSRDRPTGHRLW